MGSVPSQFDDVEKDFLSRGHLAGTFSFVHCYYTFPFEKVAQPCYWLLAGMFVN